MSTPELAARRVTARPPSTPRWHRLSLDLDGDAVHTCFSSRAPAQRIENPAALAIGPLEVYLGELQ